jgi:hypothetical protein
MEEKHEQIDTQGQQQQGQQQQGQQQQSADLQSIYDAHMKDLIRQLPNAKYTFEVTKCCNYSTFVLVNKQGSLLDLYKEVSIWFGCKNICQLFVRTETGETQMIPMTDVVSIRDYIHSQDRSLFTPIYPVPIQVVYRIYLDDGHMCLC